MFWWPAYSFSVLHCLNVYQQQHKSHDSNAYLSNGSLIFCPFETTNVHHSTEKWNTNLNKYTIRTYECYNQSNCKLQVYYMSTKTKFNVIYCNHMFYLNPFLSQPSQPLLPSPIKLTEFYNPKWTLISVCCVCVWRFGVSFTYVIVSIDSKLISVFLIHDYSLIADLHIFVYGRTEYATISLECTKVKLLILNNFDYNTGFLKPLFIYLIIGIYNL